VIEIWLNPACSKCRTAVSELDAAGKDYVVRRYLEQPPTTAELEDVLARLGLEPWDIVRTADAGKLGVTLPAKDDEHRHTWLELMSDHPGLIQRPIITASDGTTVVGRDPDSVARVIDAG
jgi:arsenate reductase